MEGNKRFVEGKTNRDLVRLCQGMVRARRPYCGRGRLRPAFYGNWRRTGRKVPVVRSRNAVHGVGSTNMQ